MLWEYDDGKSPFKLASSTISSEVIILQPNKIRFYLKSKNKASHSKRTWTIILTLKNSEQLQEELEMLVMDENCVKGLQDIESMYLMIPLEKILKLTNEHLKKDDSLNERTKWSPKQITKLLRIYLEMNFWTF